MNITNIFYPKNILSLFYCLTISLKNKKAKNILIINTEYIEKNFINKYLKKIYYEFDEIYFIKYKRLSLFKYKSIFQDIKISDKNINTIKNIKLINHLIKTYKYINFYGNNDGLESYIFLKMKKNVNFHFIEHGHGNLLHFYLNRKKFKDVIKNFILKILFFINLTKGYPVKFESYYGSLANTSMKLSINGSHVKKVVYFRSLNKLFLKYFKKVKPTQKKLIWINLCDQTLKFNSFEFNKILNFINVNLNKKNETLYIKYHPNKNYNWDNHFKKLLKFLKKEKIKFIIEKKQQSSIPIEIICLFYQIKKSYSFLSTSTLINSFLIKGYKNYIFFNYTLNNSKVNQYSNLIKNFYLKNFKFNTKFI